MLLGAAERGESDTTVLSLLVRSISTDCGVMGVAGPIGEANWGGAGHESPPVLNGPAVAVIDGCGGGGGGCC